MSVDLTIQVPDELGRRLEPFRDRLAELLERGLREVSAESQGSLKDENSIITVLASQPTPDQVLAVGPSAEMQARVGELLSRGKQGVLSRSEEVELEKYFLLEHLVRLAKGHALEQLARGG
jgi:hypothetical protein